MAPHAPLMGGPISSLSRKYGPAIIPYELGAENALFQPILTMAQKRQKWSLRPGHTRVGAKQPTLCLSSTNSLEALCNLVTPDS